jgi:hypothetical protein
VDDDSRALQREATLEEASELIKQGDADHLYHVVAQRLLAISQTYTDVICADISLQPGSLAFTRDLVLRCIARKAHQRLSSLINMTSIGDSASSLSLLRPTSEELIFARFLLTLPGKAADEYVYHKTMLELAHSLKAQSAFFETERARWPDRSPAKERLDNAGAAGPPQHVVDAYVMQEPEHADALKRLGSQFGWKGRETPSVRYMASASDSLTIYEFFYHASSSAVHASLHQLFRMVWGDRALDLHHIGDRHFEQYYRRFSLIYMSWLVAETMNTVRTVFANEWPQQLDESFNIWLALIMVPSVMQGAPAIVTARELQ